MKKTVDVVGAVIRNEEGKILCALRSEQMSMSNLWEFPGGKIEKGEDPKQALVREIHEELGYSIDVHHLVADVIHEYDNIIVHLMTYEASIVSGVVKPVEHSEVVWLHIEELEQLQWAPADIPTVNVLRGIHNGG
ncbi:MAG: (deoxy)nucleoside triphosphate pyrophosphohydrolase [Bacillaceae bacterium]